MSFCDFNVNGGVGWRLSIYYYYGHVQPKVHGPQHQHQHLSIYQQSTVHVAKIIFPPYFRSPLCLLFPPFQDAASIRIRNRTIITLRTSCPIPMPDGRRRHSTSRFEANRPILIPTDTDADAEINVNNNYKDKHHPVNYLHIHIRQIVCYLLADKLWSWSCRDHES